MRTKQRTVERNIKAEWVSTPMYEVTVIEELKKTVIIRIQNCSSILHCTSKMSKL